MCILYIVDKHYCFIPYYTAYKTLAGERTLIPMDCKNDTRPPATTPPPLRIAKYDIILAAMEPAAIPFEVKPKAATRTGVRATVATPPAATKQGMAQ